MRKLNVLILFGLTLALFAGCSTKIRFVYPSPEIKPPDPTRIIFAYAKVEDRRENRKIDDVYENNNPLQAIVKIIEEEVRSTGVFEKVLLVPEDQRDKDAYLKENNVEFLMSTSLKEFKWTVPNYGLKVGLVFATTLLGGIPGVAIGLVRTDVYGDTVMNITVKELSSGRLLIDKEYVGHYNERKMLFTCDNPATKATVGGTSLKTVMEEFKADLTEAVRLKAAK